MNVFEPIIGVSPSMLTFTNLSKRDCATSLFTFANLLPIKINQKAIQTTSALSFSEILVRG